MKSNTAGWTLRILRVIRVSAGVTSFLDWKKKKKHVYKGGLCNPLDLQYLNTVSETATFTGTFSGAKDDSRGIKLKFKCSKKKKWIFFSCFNIHINTASTICSFLPSSLLYFIFLLCILCILNLSYLPFLQKLMYKQRILIIFLSLQRQILFQREQHSLSKSGHTCCVWCLQNHLPPRTVCRRSTEMNNIWTKSRLWGFEGKLYRR